MLNIDDIIFGEKPKRIKNESELDYDLRCYKSYVRSMNKRIGEIESLQVTFPDLSVGRGSQNEYYAASASPLVNECEFFWDPYSGKVYMVSPYLVVDGLKVYATQYGISFAQYTDDGLVPYGHWEKIFTDLNMNDEIIRQIRVYILKNLPSSSGEDYAGECYWSL